MDYLVPTVIEKSAYGERAYDIYSRLLEDRIVFLGGTINDAVANIVIAQMLFLAHREPNKEMVMYINSPGGEVTAALAIYDTMQFVKSPVSTICIGLAASAAAVILSAGTKGKRFALPNSEIMIHQVAMEGVGGQASEIEITTKEILKIKARLNDVLVKHTGQNIKKIEKDTDRDYFMSADEAKKYGLIDEIIKTKKWS
ncbi:MAG: ATP-dependent Clp protease proteolytic subunit [Candidatus Parcubacteria bacterium]|nr:ATP-dependent Clp protease proteolytic subunit [Candidatus Parcubacteria bacterium]